MIEFVGSATRLSDADINEVATSLGCEPAAIRAVCKVEAGGAGFLPDGRPKILFEAHLFGRLTGHQFDGSHPNISARSWNRALYGATGAHQYDRLAEAMALDEEMALQSASWGMFQILGTNAGICGFVDAGGAPDVYAFVAAMVASERNHLAAFAKFCQAGAAAEALQTKDWVTFARVYNGPGQVDLYAGRLADAYEAAL